MYFVAFLFVICLLGFADAAPNPQGGSPAASLQPSRASSSPTPKLTPCPAWPVVYDRDPVIFPQNGCVRYKDVVAPAGGRADIYREANINKLDPATSQRLLAMRSLVSQMLSFYASELGQSISVILTMAREDKQLYDGADAITDLKPGTSSPCHVLVKVQPTKGPKWLQHLVAHELYHCVQSKESPSRARESSQLEWVIEGSATFFEFYLFPTNPTTEEDENRPQKYEPSVPLYNQGYVSSLFFLFLHNYNWNLKRIDSWVRGRELRNNTQDERNDLAKDGALQEAFGRFAVKFHDKQILFDSPQKKFRVITKNPVPVMQTKAINLPTEGASDELPIEVESWTFSKYSATLLPGQTISVTVSWVQPSGGLPAPRVILWHRALRTGKKASAWSQGQPNVLKHSGCNAAAITYEFLVVPVAEAPMVTGKLVFSRGKTATCACNLPGGPTKRAPAAAPDLSLDSRQVGDSGNSSEGGFTGQTAATTLATPTQLAPPPLQTLATTVTTGTAPTPTDTEEGREGWGGESGDDWLESEPGTTDGGEDLQDGDGTSDGVEGGSETNEDDCDPPAPRSFNGLECLIGNWAADKASMDAHNVLPYFRYTVHPFSANTVQYSGGSYTLAITADPADPADPVSNSSSNVASFLFSEVLTEESFNTAQTSASTTPTTLKTISISNVHGTVIVYLDASNATNIISGSIIRTPSASNSSITFVQDGYPSTSSDPKGAGYGPRGTAFEFNCTATTLNYIDMASFGPLSRSYTFQRV